MRTGALNFGPAALLAALGALAVAVTLAACGDDDPAGSDPRSGNDSPAGKDARSSAAGGEPPIRTQLPPPGATNLPPARCPPDAGNCRSADGRILYVERVDPDGDGDAHFVLASDESVTAPGLTVVDVRRELRPRPLPGPGDRISASGPVFRGSYGQRQIQANVIHVARRTALR
jgi:hypothetical protein